MVILALVAVALLSLSAISLRSSTQESHEARARANARMGLMTAIGRLQSELGPDQRISANSSILSTAPVRNPHWLGVWDSWKAGPGEASQHRTLQGVNDTLHPTYEPNRRDRFRSWLVSLDDANADLLDAARDLQLVSKPMPDADTRAVVLVGEGSLGPGAAAGDVVSAPLVPIASGAGAVPNGRHAWWISDESQKARLLDDPDVTASGLTPAERIFRQQAAPTTGTRRVEGLEEISDDSQLASLPSLATLNLLSGVVGRPSLRNFHHVTPHSFQVLADVREGGLKRDLSILLERPINPAETGDEFMLYRFGTKDSWANIPALPNTPQECVPIQDLAAFYQLYDHDPNGARGRKGGVEHSAGDIHVKTPDYGTTTTWATKFLREYTGLYRNPVPIKVQFLLSLTAVPITDTDRAHPNNIHLPAADDYKLRLAVFPAITLWNPSNLPLVMQSGALCQQFSLKPPSLAIRCQKRRPDGTVYNAKSLNLAYAIVGSSVSDGRAERRSEILRLNFARNETIRFEPGEVKVFSLPFTASGDVYVAANPMNNAPAMPKNLQDASVGWNPQGYFTFTNSTVSPGPLTVVNTHHSNVVYEAGPPARYSLSLGGGDQLAFTVVTESTANAAENMSQSVSPIGAGLCFYMAPRVFATTGYAFLNLRHQGLVSRMGGAVGVGSSTTPAAFNRALLAQGMPGQVTQLPMEPIPVSQIVTATGAGESQPFLQMALMAGCETSELQNGGLLGGRKFPSRPFLHSSPIQPTFIDQNDAVAPYNHGWNWWIEDMNSVLEALVQESASGNGYYGGGYSPESGSTRVIQQEIPLVPPISIAALSHARLGGFSLAGDAPAGQGLTGTGQAEGYGPNTGWVDNPSPTLGFQRVTSGGQGGLFPHVLQAIGNSYANPNLSADAAYNSSWQRLYDQDNGVRNVTFADHSYLANKALWDDCFFSSLTPQRGAIPPFGGTDRTLAQVARDFFLTDPARPLPNRRIVAHAQALDQAKLDALVGEASIYTNGMADKIAAHLMVEGGFNINSTSVDAWKVFLSSLRGKPVAYLAGGSNLQEADTEGTPVGYGALPHAAPMTGSISGPNSPEAQWLGWRELSDEEIAQLAEAMVRQVKQRGPFLSLSDFVNRRLDASNEDFALKGALQAALDDESVSINSSFRAADRMLDGETGSTNFAFAAAARGPIAYGSSAYVDQADVLRHLAEQISPRGDTFVIRSYGDALDANGDVVARAWCEAVVQRVPEYCDPKASDPASGDDPQVKQAELSSETNRRFGRKMQMVAFRWLHPSEI